MAAIRAVNAVSLSILLLISVLLPQMSRGYATMAEPQLNLSAIKIKDASGVDLGNIISPGQQNVITFDVSNDGNSGQSFAALLQISSPAGTTYLARQIGTAPSGDSMALNFTWEAEKVGIYTIKAFLWTSLDIPTALSSPSETRMEVSVIPAAKVQITPAVLTPLQESPTPVERSDVTECLNLFSGAATSPYSANTTITIHSMHRSYQADFDYRIAGDFDSDIHEANNIASDPPNVNFLERETISMVLFSNVGIAEDAVSIYHKDVSDCDILYNPLEIPASEKVVLETLSIEQIESNSGKYMVKIAMPDKVDVSADHSKLVVEYMDNDDSIVIYVVTNVGIEPSESEVALCYNLFNGTMSTPTVANTFISINAVHGTHDVDADYSRLEDDLDNRGFVYYLNPNSSDAEDTIFVEGEKLAFTIRSNGGGGSSSDSEAIATLYTQDVSDCDIVFQPDSVPSSKMLRLGSTNVTDLGDGTYLHEVVIPLRSIVGDDFTKLFISYKYETESRVYYSLPNLRIIASNTNDSQSVDVSITNGSSTKTSDAYTPNPITINVGDTVTWTNDDSELHTVTSGSKATSDGKFDSSPDFDPLMGPEATFSHTFTEVGEYPYYCGLHPSMVGTVTVAAN